VERIRRSELALHELHPVPLDYCGADTQGAIGYMIQKALRNEFIKVGIDKQTATIVTQVQVDSDDPAFLNPSKPIGSFLDESTAGERIAEGQVFVEDAGRGWRRVVPSPKPVDIIEVDAIKLLIQAGMIVVAVGGGGIPVIEKEHGRLRGVEAVIDKDMIDADLLLISTSVEKVALNFNRPDQVWLDEITVSQVEDYIRAGHFLPGSMLPKMQACIEFIKAGGEQALITDPKNIGRALNGETGTWIRL